MIQRLSILYKETFLKVHALIFYAYMCRNANYHLCAQRSEMSSFQLKTGTVCDILVIQKANFPTPKQIQQNIFVQQ